NDAASNEWGRIDVDGTAYVRTESGERVIGSWQAGDPQAGLAHFTRRYDDVVTEVELLEQRLRTGAGDPAGTLTHANELRASLDSVAVIGDLAALERRLTTVGEHAQSKLAEVAEARAEAKVVAVQQKEALVTEAEQLAQSTQWKVSGDRFRLMIGEWKAIRGVDRRTDETLWKRFAAARDAFTKRRGSYFADLDRQRAEARVRKEELVAEAEDLADSTDWAPTASRLKALMAEWKASGRASREAEEQLWTRFRAAQDRFFARRSEVFSERDAEQVANQRAKEALLAEAESLDPKDLDKTKARMREIQERWDGVGHVPREAMRGLEQRMRAAEQRIRDAVDDQWRRTDPAAQARLEQVRAQVSKYEAQAAKAHAAGNERKAADAEANAAIWREWLAEAERAVGG
ncbi:MAG TPA: DUF349 domain-containing protein, partial [Mycobacteriales bacterium]|nr:DUF349 domain-containing protein [Mycobacteriales bacterium]